MQSATVIIVYPERNNKLTKKISKRAAGIEPASTVWKTVVLPLNYARRGATLAKYIG